MTNQKDITLSDGQDRIYIVCRKLINITEYLESYDRSHHDSVPDLKAESGSLLEAAKPLNTELHNRQEDMYSVLDCASLDAIVRYEQAVFALEEKLVEALASMDSHQAANETLHGSMA